MKAGIVTGPRRDGWHPIGSYCCRCGARDGRELIAVLAPCSCVPMFCQECIDTSFDRDVTALSFEQWLEAWARSCLEDYERHVEYGPEWSNGRDPLREKMPRDRCHGCGYGRGAIVYSDGRRELQPCCNGYCPL